MLGRHIDDIVIGSVSVIFHAVRVDKMFVGQMFFVNKTWNPWK